MVIYYNEDKTYYTEKLDMFMVLSVWWLRCYSAETTYLKPSSHFLLHLNFDGGKKTFFPPLPTFYHRLLSRSLID